MFKVSPLTRLSVIEATKDDKRAPSYRPETPADMEYSHLGALKLGSLVITNGMASPAPSIMMPVNVSRRQSTPDLRHREKDYFTASEGYGSPEGLGTASTFQPDLDGRRSRSPTAPFSRKVRTGRDASEPTKFGSPLRKERRQDSSDDEPRLESPLKASSTARQPRNYSALDLAENYMAELPMSPYGDQDSFLDDLICDDASFVDQETVDFRTQALKRLDGSFTEADVALTMPTLDSEPSPPPHLARKDALKLERPIPETADSGYSSGTSLSALQAPWNPADDASVYSNRASQYELEAAEPGSSNTVSAAEQASPRGSSDNKSFETSRPTTKAATDAPKDEGRARPAKTRRKSIIRSVSWHRTKHQSLPATPTSPNSLSAGSTRSAESKDRKSKKLQKQRPSAHDLPIVQGQRPITAGSIPCLPVDVVEKFCKRIRSSPDMEALDRTFASVRATDSAESFEEPIPFAVPIIFPGDSARSSRVFEAEVEITPPPPPPPHGQVPAPPTHQRSKSYAAGSYNGHRAADDYNILGVADFGTVAESLGGSPYDIAMGIFKAPSPTKPTMPHHLSAPVVVQAASRTEVNAETATAYERARRRDRAGLPARDTRCTSRPRSFHEGDLNQGERFVKNFSRPHSMYEDAPPVPALPADNPSLSRGSSAYSAVELAASPAKSANNSREGPRGNAVPAPIRAPPPPPVQVPRSNTAPQPPAAKINWEAQRQLWRQRRRSIGEGFLRKPDSSSANSPDTAPVAPVRAAPAIVISRYITPMGHPSPSGTDTATAAVAPPKRPASPGIAALAARFEQHSDSHGRSKSAVGLIASTAPRSRSADSVYSARSTHYTPYSPTTVSIPAEDFAEAKNPQASLMDRYSGGLAYGYEAGFGVGGSAGTRNLRSAASRKSLGFAQSFGVDLSDVPVFVTKVG